MNHPSRFSRTCVGMHPHIRKVGSEATLHIVTRRIVQCLPRRLNHVVDGWRNTAHGPVAVYGTLERPDSAIIPTRLAVIAGGAMCLT
jgi:hypothetical protein